MEERKSFACQGRWRRGGERRDWCHLPAPALLCISQHLDDIVHYHAFAGTCRVWRDVANFGKKAFMASQPPLLCSASGKRFYSPVNGKCYKNRRIAAIIRRLRGTIVDVSHGYLVVEADCAPRQMKIVLLNPLTNHRIGNLPRIDADFLNWVVLTAPPTSPDCVVVACTGMWSPRRWTWGPYSTVSTVKNAIEYTKPGDSHWTLFQWETNIDDTFKPVASADGRIYTWALEGDVLQLVVMEFLHGPKQTCLTTVTLPESCPCPVFLTAPRAELLLVRASFAPPDGSVVVQHGTFEIYQLDLSMQRLVRKKDCLGDCALVMDYFKCSVADNPGKWGGQSDHIYFSIGYGPEAWKFNLNGATSASHLAPFDYENLHYRASWLLPGTCF